MEDPLAEQSSSSGAHSSTRAHRADQKTFWGYTIAAIGIAIIVRLFIASPYVVSGASMEPTFHDWHYLIVDRIVYDVRAPHRGEVVVFRYPPEPSRYLIKRVIGLPGETVIIDGASVTIKNAAHPEGITLSEPYVSEENRTYGDKLQTTLGTDQYFVLGDNRRVSADSRLWGPLPIQDIIGRVDLRLFPFNEIGITPEQVTYAE